jgi:two-component system NtrC family response regulator
MTSVAIEGAPKVVVIVDDEPDIVTIFKKVLEMSGYRAFGFTDPLDALNHLQSGQSCDLIISDIRMPGMDGIEFVTRVRQFNTTVTILLMSAFDRASLEIASELQIAAFLQKPLAPSELKEIMSKHLPIRAR